MGAVQSINQVAWTPLALGDVVPAGGLLFEQLARHDLWREPHTAAVSWQRARQRVNLALALIVAGLIVLQWGDWDEVDRWRLQLARLLERNVHSDRFLSCERRYLTEAATRLLATVESRCGEDVDAARVAVQCCAVLDEFLPGD